MELTSAHCLVNMASKKTSKAAPANDDIDDLFSGIGGDATAKKTTSSSKTSKSTSKSAAAADKDILADLESELTQQPASRPHTPRAGKRSTATPPIADDKFAAAARKSTDSAHSLRASFTPSATSSEPQESEKRVPVEQAPAIQQQQQQQQAQENAGGGWWGGILSTATSAMKQAEAAYKEIQQNEEAKKWADQVRGLSHLDVSTLRSYGTRLVVRSN